MARKRYDDEDDEDDRPRKRRYDEDDDEDDRPRKRRHDRRPKRQQTSSGGIGVVWIVVAASLLLIGLGVTAFLLVRGSGNKPEPEVADKQTPNGATAPNNGSPPARPNAGPDPGGAAPAVPPGVVVPIPSLTPTVKLVVFGGGADGYAAIVANNQAGQGSLIDVVNTATGKPAGRIQTTTPSDSGYAVSPKGTWFVVLGANHSDGTTATLFSVETGRPVKQFTPYPKPTGFFAGPDTVWITITAKEQLLTVNSEGAFDLWTLPELKRTTGVAAILKGGDRVYVDAFTFTPKNFSLSIDGGQLAIFNGSGFSFYNTETATEVGRTPDVLPPGNAPLFSAAALSPDGTKFACYYRTLGTATSTTTLNVWDTKTGRPLGSPPVKGRAPAGFAWWGPSHLVFWDGGIATGTLLNVGTGQVAGSVRVALPGKFATVPPTGQLWGVVGPNSYNATQGTAFLARADLPAVIRPDAQFELTQNGLKLK